jgi:septal ring factor EnvC (AmiA/AmiB activator)
MSSGSVQITVALIGVAGSLAVAYLTTGATFESKLKADAASISELRDSVRAVATQMSHLIARLDSAQTGVDTLTRQVRTVGAQVQRLHLNPAVFERLEQLQKRPDD